MFKFKTTGMTVCTIRFVRFRFLFSLLLLLLLLLLLSPLFFLHHIRFFFFLYVYNSVCVHATTTTATATYLNIAICWHVFAVFPCVILKQLCILALFCVIVVVRAYVHVWCSLLDIFGMVLFSLFFFFYLFSLSLVLPWYCVISNKLCRRE